MKIAFNLFTYISIAFVVIYLYYKEYLIIPPIQSYNWLLISLFFLFTGFLLNAKAWQCLLNSNKYRISYAEALSSLGLAIFGKYIPGKLWGILGRAMYLRNVKGFPILQVSGLSLLCQTISISVGIMVGSFALGYEQSRLHYIILCFVLIFIFIISTPLSKASQLKIPSIEKIRPALNFLGPHLIATFPWFVLVWVFWGFGFYSLVASITAAKVWSVGFAFVISATVGIIAFFVPGGIGVREGALCFLLIQSGYSVDMAVTLAIGSRIWFLTGEIFIFICGLLAKVNNLSQPKIMK